MKKIDLFCLLVRLRQAKTTRYKNRTYFILNISLCSTKYAPTIGCEQ